MILIALIVILFFINCFDFNIQRDIDYPQELFESYENKISKITNNVDPSQLKLLVYDGSDRQLIQLSLPIQLVGKFSDEEQIDLDYDQMSECSKGLLNSFDIKDLKRIMNAGRGLLLEVFDLEENSHVLIWLE